VMHSGSREVGTSIFRCGASSGGAASSCREP
jgi:hypothetical protein